MGDTVNDEHQKGVAKIAASFAKRFELPSWGYALGLLHDKGKERAAFQQYIRKVNGLSTDDKKHYNDHAHAFVGGILAKDFMGKDVLNLLANQIISHHTGRMIMWKQKISCRKNRCLKK